MREKKTPQSVSGRQAVEIQPHTPRPGHDTPHNIPHNNRKQRSQRRLFRLAICVQGFDAHCVVLLRGRPENLTPGR